MKTLESEPKKYGRGQHPNSRKAVEPYLWKPGQCPNPGGRPKNDIAKEIAQAVFSNNKEAIYIAMAKTLLKGNAHTFKELAERGYGKPTEKIEVTTDEEMIAALLAGRKRAHDRNKKKCLARASAIDFSP